ncbi:MAG: response regulator [Verrucomicrobia bacterium]|nr:response regulator [Verrucomicrobiota bacterium]
MKPTASQLPERPSVLLVEDEAPLRQVMQLGLAPQFDVETAASAEQAEKLMATRSYDVVVSDHLMHHTTGLDFLRLAKERHPGTMRIMITGYTNPELISRSVSLAGLAACLVKPIPSEELARVIWAALGRTQ